MKSIQSLIKNSDRILIGGMGGGGDILSSLPSYWQFKRINPDAEFYFAAINPVPLDNLVNYRSINVNGQSCSTIAEVTKKSEAGRYRLIEKVVAKKFDQPVPLLSTALGRKLLLDEINTYLHQHEIDTFCLIDAGTDSIAKMGGQLSSIVDDVLGLVVLADCEVENKIHGLTSFASDGEMSIHSAMAELARLYQINAVYGTLSFPNEYILGNMKIYYQPHWRSIPHRHQGLYRMH